MFMPLHALYRTSYPHFMTTMFGIYDITFTIFSISHALYMKTHLLCMMSHSLYVVNHTMTLSYQTLYVHDIFTLYGITHSVMNAHHCVPSQPLCLILYSKYFCHYTKCSNFMTRSECKSSQPLYV